MKITIGNNKNINKAAVTEASEEVKAASEGKTELVKERRLCRRIYSGGYKKTIAEFHGEPVFYKTEDGGYREIDNTLADSGDCLEAARRCLAQGRRSMLGMLSLVDSLELPEDSLTGFDVGRILTNVNDPEEYARALEFL